MELYSGPGGWNNTGSNPFEAIRSRLSSAPDRRWEMAKINRQHELGVERDAHSHQLGIERLLLEHGLRSTEAERQREFEGQQAVANRTLEYNRMETQTSEAARQREHEMNRVGAEGTNAIRLAREQGRQARSNLRATVRVASGGLAPGTSVSASGLSVQMPKAQEASEAPAAPKPRKPRQPKKA